MILQDLKSAIDGIENDDYDDDLDLDMNGSVSSEGVLLREVHPHSHAHQNAHTPIDMATDQAVEEATETMGKAEPEELTDITPPAASSEEASGVHTVQEEQVADPAMQDVNTANTSTNTDLKATFVNAFHSHASISWVNLETREEIEVIANLPPHERETLDVVHRGHEFVAFVRAGDDILQQRFIVPSFEDEPQIIGVEFAIGQETPPKGFTEEEYFTAEEVVHEEVPIDINVEAMNANEHEHEHEQEQLMHDHHLADQVQDTDIPASTSTNTDLKATFINAYHSHASISWVNPDTKEETEVIPHLPPQEHFLDVVHRGHEFVAYVRAVDSDEILQQRFTIPSFEDEPEMIGVEFVIGQETPPKVERYDDMVDPLMDAAIQSEEMIQQQYEEEEEEEEEEVVHISQHSMKATFINAYTSQPPMYVSVFWVNPETMDTMEVIPNLAPQERVTLDVVHRGHEFVAYAGTSDDRDDIQERFIIPSFDDEPEMTEVEFAIHHEPHQAEEL